MNSTADALAQVASGLRGLLSGDGLAGLSDDDRAAVLVALGEVSRLADAATVETVATADAEFGHRFGCRGMNELLRRAVLVDSAAAGKLIRAAQAISRDVNLVSGERLPARWPALREALLDGAVGVDGLLAAIRPIDNARDRITPEQRLWADRVLAAFARGEELPDDADAGDADGADAGDTDADETSPDADAETDADADADADADVPGSADSGAARGPRASAEDLKQFASVLAVGLDPDGAEPSDREAQARRYLTIGRLRRGVHPVHGNITPEVAAQLNLIFDAFDNPKVGGAPAPGVQFDTDDTDDEDPFNSDPRGVIDTRTPGQKRHDALAAALGIAARHHDMPTLGGAAPTLVVHVDVNDFAAGTGWATIPGEDGRVPVRTAAHTACTGTIQRVLFDEGRIIGITTIDRVFTAYQRRAIVARDKECLIPGCHVPATWCEIHHVIEHARGGPTSTSNGVPLCWWHHRTLDHSGWQIRMHNGLPEIRGPAWWDPYRRWRTPRLSRPATTPLRT